MYFSKILTTDLPDYISENLFFRTPFFLRTPPVAACSPSFSEQVSLIASVFVKINKIHGNMKSTVNEVSI